MMTMCSTTEKSANSERKVDAPLHQCDHPAKESLQENKRNTEMKSFFDETCLPPSQSRYLEESKSSANQVLCKSVKSCQEFVHEPCQPQPPKDMSLPKSTPIPRGFCLPIGGSLGQGNSDQCKPIMVCLPGKPHFSEEDKCKKEEIKPIGLITRNKEADFIAGKFIYGCTCGRKNGLQSECPRLSCQDNPGCSMNPPRCWPQFKEPPKPAPIPDQKMICVPVQLVYYDPSNASRSGPSGFHPA